MNSFLAISLDIYNKKEHIIYCIGYANEFFSGSGKNVAAECRELGEYVFDFASKLDYFMSESRLNVLYEYLSEYQRFIEVNTLHWKYNDSLMERYTAFKKSIDTLKKPILTDNFFEKQKHLSFNDRHKLTSYELLKDKTDYGSLHFFYIKDRMYAATDFDFIGLLRYYLDELYNASLFPRRCMSCGKLFLSGKKHGEVLCSTECRRKKKSQNTMTYYGNLSENEVLFTKIYRKWKQRIDRADINHTISEKGIEQLRQELKELTNVNRLKANDRKKGNVPEKDGVHDYKSFDNKYRQVLEDKDKDLYELFKFVKSN